MSAGRETPDKPGRLLEVAIQLLAAAPVVFLPWFFGGVQSSIQVWLLACLLVASILAVVAVQRDEQRSLVPIAALPLLLALLLGVLQIVPLPMSVLERLAPRNAALWGQQAGLAMSADGRQRASEAATDYETISLYPASARRDLALLVGAVGLFMLGAQFFCRPSAHLAMLGLVAINGAAIAFCGLALALRPTMGAAELVKASSSFATFINRNHAAGFLNISLGAAIGLAIWSFARARESHREIGTGRATGRISSRRTLRELVLQAQTRLANVTGRQLLSIVLTALISAGILCALSRGAWLGALCASIVTAAALAIAKGANRGTWTLLVAGALGLALVCWIGKGDLIPRRLNTLWNRPLDGRLAHWKDGLATAGDYFPLGSGLGTYRFAYLAHDSTAGDAWFYHAENQYLEAVVEQGAFGLLFLLAAIGLAAYACRRLLLEPMDSVAFACGAAALFALVTQVVHSMFDFGLYVPANMAALALIMGGTCGMAVRLQATGGERSRSDCVSMENASTGFAHPAWAPRLLYLPVSKTAAAMGVTLLAVAAGLACAETRRGASIDRVLRPVKGRILGNEISTPGTLKVATSELEHALSIRADDAEGQLALAKLKILSYRTKLLGRWQEQSPSADLRTLWRQTSPVELHGWGATLKREQRQFELESVRQSASVLTDLAPAVEHLFVARQACPLLAETHLLLAELETLVSPAEDADHLARMRSITTDPDLLLESGLVEFQAGHLETAIGDWRQVIAKMPQRLGDVLEFVAQAAGGATAMGQLLPSDPASLVELARTRFMADNQQTIQQLLLRRASESIETCQDAAKRHYLAATIHSLQNETLPAIGEIQKALQLRPGETNWRYDLALLLQKAGETTAAHEQAGLCLTQEPDNPRYELLLRQLVRSELTNSTNAQ